MATRGRSVAKVAAWASVALVAAMGAPGFARPAQAAPLSAASTGYRHGSVPTIGAARAHAAAPAAGSANELSYGGGNAGVGVTTGAPQVYLVFWGSQWGVPATNGQGNLTLSGDPKAM